MKQIYEAIRDRRKELGMSQDNLAKAVGYTSRSTIARIEKGEIDVPISSLLKMAVILKLPISNLLNQEADSIAAEKGLTPRYLSEEEVKLIDGRNDSSSQKHTPRYLNEEESHIIDSFNALKPKERLLLKGIIDLMVE